MVWWWGFFLLGFDVCLVFFNVFWGFKNYFLWGGGIVN